MNACKIKYTFFAYLVLFSCVVLSQNDVNLFDKIKQEHSEKLFYESVFKNPSLMPYFGRNQVSNVEATYSHLKDEAYFVQRPNKENSFGLLASSFYPVDSTQTLWGRAGYKSKNQKKIIWNESIDYDLIYPYVTADSVGGNLKNEEYSFLGGYAKSYKKIDVGAVFGYQATLASRDRDPRLENTSSNLKAKIGVNFKNGKKRSIGLHAGIQKYTQENDITFFSEISSPAVYHLNGLGYFNNVLRGTYLKAFYDGFGYELGMQIKPLKKDDLWLSVNFNQLNIQKFIVETLSTESSELKNRSINIDVVKLFKQEKNTLGLRLSYGDVSKIGIESVISARGGLGLNIVAQNENYNLKERTFKFSGLFYKEDNRHLFSLSPYVSYQNYKEDYVLVRSFQYFDYLYVGANSKYLKNINSRTVFLCSFGINYKAVLYKSSLLREDSEVSLSEMVRHNNELLGTNFISSNLGISIDRNINSGLNMFWGVKSNFTVLNNSVNNVFTLSTGIRF